MTREYNQQRLLAWLMWLLTVSFFAYQFVLRISPGLIINDIMSKFAIDASEYGSLSAMYYYGYASMQIPIAILIDKYGSKLIGFCSAFICAISCIVFAYSDNWLLLLLCRCLIGAASAAAFLNVSKIISMWFDPKFYGRMISITFSLGLIGAVYGGKPLNSLINFFGWDVVLSYVGILGVFISVLILIFVKNNPHFVPVDDTHIWEKLKKVIANGNLIALAVANLLMVGALEGFADVWGVTYLVKIFSYTKSEAAFITTFIFVGMILGGPILAFIAEKRNAHYSLTAFCGLGIALIFFLIITLQPRIPTVVLYIMMFLVGIFCCYQVLMFTIASSTIDPSLVSITIAFLNCVNMLGGSFFHTSIGKMMDYMWEGEILDSLKIYNIEAYNYSISIIPFSALIGSIIVIIINSRIFKKSPAIEKEEEGQELQVS